MAPATSLKFSISNSWVNHESSSSTPPPRYFRVVAIFLAFCVLIQTARVHNTMWSSGKFTMTTTEMSQPASTRPGQHDATTITITTNSSAATNHNEKNKGMSWKEFEALNERLVSHAYPTMGCPNGCGCPEHKVDCPQLYSIDDVKASAEATLTTTAEEEFKLFIKGKHEPNQAFCQTASEDTSTRTGGYCLFNRTGATTITLPNGHPVQVVPPGHVVATPRIVWEMVELLKTDGATSLSDFGAGVGQYASEIAPHLAPDFQYNAFDGAGNIEEYTKSYVRYADLSAPLNLPRTDWVMSLEVGEHVPARFEGIFLRNLHRHNCKGVVLSWGVLGQDGLHHINNHSNEYMVRLFTELGYERDVVWEQRFRNNSNNKWWFVGGSFVFRRKVPVC